MKVQHCSDASCHFLHGKYKETCINGFIHGPPRISIDLMGNCLEDFVEV